MPADDDFAVAAGGPIDLDEAAGVRRSSSSGDDRSTRSMRSLVLDGKQNAVLTSKCSAAYNSSDLVFFRHMAMQLMAEMFTEALHQLKIIMQDAIIFYNSHFVGCRNESRPH